jgi:hypothetical protein
LGFSKTERDNFKEMRKFAAHFPETAHLATVPTVNRNGDAKTETNASWWYPADEHREKYSMGAGYYLKSTGRYSTGWTVRKRRFYCDNTPENMARILGQIPTDAEWCLNESPKAASSPRVIASNTASYSIEEHTHTKHGFQFFLVVLADRVERDQFDALRDASKALGGWYSRQWGKTPGGFAFKSLELAEQFCSENLNGPTIDPPGYSKRVQELEDEGLTTSDAQAAADVEYMQDNSRQADPRMLETTY